MPAVPSCRAASSGTGTARRPRPAVMRPATVTVSPTRSGTVSSLASPRTSSMGTRCPERRLSPGAAGAAHTEDSHSPPTIRAAKTAGRDRPAVRSTASGGGEHKWETFRKRRLQRSPSNARRPNADEGGSTVLPRPIRATGPPPSAPARPCSTGHFRPLQRRRNSTGGSGIHTCAETLSSILLIPCRWFPWSPSS